MTAPTHGLFAIVICKLFGISYNYITFATLGSIIPDIDHPRSVIGRVFFFISYPINRLCGHRTITHSFVVWLLLLLVGGFITQITQCLFWMSIGAISHVIIDALNTSGVQMFYPYSRKTFVLGGESWRFPTASKQEFIFFFVLGILVGMERQIGLWGGMRGLVRMISGSYDLIWQDYREGGLTEYYISGTWRRREGEIYTETYEVIGECGEKKLAVSDGNNIYVLPDDIQPLRGVRGKKGKHEWKVIKIDGLAVCRGSGGYIWSGKKWMRVNKGDIIWGIYKTKEEVELEPYNSSVL